MYFIHASFPVFHDFIDSIFFYVCCFQYNYNPRTNLFFLDCLSHLSELERTHVSLEGAWNGESWEPAMLLFCQRFTEVWHAATFQHGRQNRNQRPFEVTEVENFRVFDGAFYAKRLDHPVQLARNTGRTGVFGRNPASKQKKNVRWGLISLQRSLDTLTPSLPRGFPLTSKIVWR